MTTPTEQPTWHRSSACTNGACIEIARVAGGYLIRDAKNPDAAPLSVSDDEWNAFAGAVKRDEFRFE